MKRSATAVWNGLMKEGNGTLTTPSLVLHSTQYTFGSRFESSPGINPEELIAAAHAGCFAMILSGALGNAGFPPERLEVTAEISLEEKPALGWTLIASHLVLTARIPLIDAEKFMAIAEEAKASPVSRALNTTVTLEAKLQ